MLLCIDGSLRTCVMLASTNLDIAGRLSKASESKGLRLMIESPDMARFIQTQLSLRWCSKFHISELILTCSYWPWTAEFILAYHLLEMMALGLRKVKMNPEHANMIKEIYDTDWLAESVDEGINLLRKTGQFEITARYAPTVQPLSKQLKLTQFFPLVVD